MKKQLIAGLIFSMLLGSTIALADNNYEQRKKKHQRGEHHQAQRQHSKTHRSERRQKTHHRKVQTHHSKVQTHHSKVQTRHHSQHSRPHHTKRHHSKRHHYSHHYSHHYKHHYRYYSHHSPYYEFLVGAAIYHSLTKPRVIIVQSDRYDDEPAWLSNEDYLSSEQENISGCYIVYTGVDGEELRKDLPLSECDKP